MAQAINEEFEDQYSCKWNVRVPQDQVVPLHISTCEKQSEKSLIHTPIDQDVVYGPGNNQHLHIFGIESAPPDAPVFVFIHGGYWQAMGRQYYSFMAPPVVKAGAIFVLIGYDLTPTVTLKELVDEVRAGLCRVLQIARSRGSRGVYISGHSAGGHLTAMMLATDWRGVYKEDSKLIKGAYILSGVFDLRPLVHTTINKPLHLTERVLGS